MAFGKIAVLGGGPGSQAVAADLARRGYEVSFWGRNRWKLAKLFATKQITTAGAFEGDVQLAEASDDLGQIMRGARLVVISLPGFAQTDIAQRCAPYLEDGQIVLICGLSGMSSLEFTRTIREKGIAKDVLCAEWAGIPAGGRFLESGAVNVSDNFVRHLKFYSPHIAVFPAKRTGEAMETISQVYPGLPSSENCLANSLSIRAIMHQAVVMLLSSAAIEHFVYWDITAEGHTPSALKLIKAVDDERKAIQQAWGFEVTEVYGQKHLSGEIDYDAIRLYRDKAAWKDRLNMRHRFITEGVPFGHVLRSSAAERVGLDVPVTNSLIRIFSVINGEDYRGSGRSLDALGLGGMSAEQVRSFLQEGYG